MSHQGTVFLKGTMKYNFKKWLRWKFFFFFFTKIIIIKNPTELLNCDLWVEGKVNLWAKPMVLNEEVTGILNRKCEIN